MRFWTTFLLFVFVELEKESGISLPTMTSSGHILELPEISKNLRTLVADMNKVRLMAALAKTDDEWLK